MTQPNQDQAVREWMVSLGFEIVPDVDGWTFAKSIDARFPHLTDGKTYWQLNRDEALVFYTICQKAAAKPIDHSIDVWNEPDPVKAFDLFIKKWCPDYYSHLIDSDENDGEFMRHKIQKAERKFAAKELGRVYLGEEGGGASHVYTTDDAGNEVEIDERILQLTPPQDTNGKFLNMPVIFDGDVPIQDTKQEKD